MKKEYLAGMIDGEGCIMIHKSKRKGYKNYVFDLRMFVSNSHLDGLKEIQKWFGGNLNEVRPDKQRFSKNRCWRLWWNGKSAYNLLNLLVNSLFIKKSQALIAIEFYNKKLSGIKDFNILNPLYQEISIEKRKHLISYYPQRLSESTSFKDEAIVQSV